MRKAVNIAGDAWYSGYYAGMKEMETDTILKIRHYVGLSTDEKRIVIDIIKTTAKELRGG